MEPATPHHFLADFLKQYRQDNGLTVQDLAQRCQIPMATLMGLELGDRPLDEDLEALARGLDMTLQTIRRASVGEPVLAPPPPAETPTERPATLLEAIRGLTPSQIEKVKDFIAYLRWAERQTPDD